jgi:ligand-binding sensor domain-containing protein
MKQIPPAALFVLLFLASCNGQFTSQIANTTLNEQHSFSPGHYREVTVIGDTVSETHDSILVIFQDKNNNFWFGSNGHGVYRYDPAGTKGKNIIHYTTKDGLCNNHVRGIQEDKTGNIYINTVGGINKYDSKSFTKLNIVRSTLPDRGWRLHPDDLWFKGAQDSGVVYRYDGAFLYRLEFPKTKAGEEHVSKFPRSEYPSMTFSPYDVYTIYKDRKGNVWFGTGNLGICRYDGKTFSWMYEEHLSLVKGGGSFGIRSILEDKKGKFWFCNTRFRYDIAKNDSTDGGNNFIKYRREKGMDYPGKEDEPLYFMSITEDNEGNLWMATYNQGAWKYDPDGTSGKNLTNYPVMNGDQIVNVYSIYKDKQGDLWLGTHTAGAYKFNGKTFEKFMF